MLHEHLRRTASVVAPALHGMPDERRGKAVKGAELTRVNLPVTTHTTTEVLTHA